MEYSNPEFATGQDFYPGQDWCDPWNPHSKWHKQTAIALTNLVFLGDQFYELLTTGDISFSAESSWIDDFLSDVEDEWQDWKDWLGWRME